MEKAFNRLDRIDLFAQDIIAQISFGHKETITKIVEEMDKKHVVRYLYEKYHDNLYLSLGDNCPYNVDDWEEIYSQYAYISSNDARRKWGIVNEDDGLLLLVSLTFEALREKLY